MNSFVTITVKPALPPKWWTVVQPEKDLFEPEIQQKICAEIVNFQQFFSVRLGQVLKSDTGVIAQIIPLSSNIPGYNLS